MRTVLQFGRQCLRRCSPKCPAPFASRGFVRPSKTGIAFLSRHFATPRFDGRTILWSGAATAAVLSPLVFVEIGQDKAGNGEKTHEEAMLEASRKELGEQVPAVIKHST